MIQLKTRDEIQRISDSGDILNATIKEVGKHIQEGITTKELDRIAYDFITKSNAIPAFLNYGGFPASACISVNEQVIHGIPGSYRLKKSDLVSVDIGVDYKGYISDSAYTFTVGKVGTTEQKLLDRTQAALAAGIKAAVVGNRIRDISEAIYNVIGKDYGVVADYCGHGVGFEVHEDPQVSNFFPVKGRSPRIKAGLVIAIEPMVNLGTGEVFVLPDEWTVVTKDRKKSAHFEHTIGITEEGPLILT